MPPGILSLHLYPTWTFWAVTLESYRRLYDKDTSACQKMHLHLINQSMQINWKSNQIWKTTRSKFDENNWNLMKTHKKWPMSRWNVVIYWSGSVSIWTISSHCQYSIRNWCFGKASQMFCRTIENQFFLLVVQILQEKVPIGLIPCLMLTLFLFGEKSGFRVTKTSPALCPGAKSKNENDSWFKFDITLIY